MKPPSGDWHALRLFNLYRMVLSGLLVTLLILPQVNLSAALWSPTFFGAVALLYLVAAVGFSFTIRAQERSGQEQLQLQIVVDILALSLLGLSSGHPVEIFGALLLIPVAFAGYWQPGRLTQFLRRPGPARCPRCRPGPPAAGPQGLPGGRAGRPGPGAALHRPVQRPQPPPAPPPARRSTTSGRATWPASPSSTPLSSSGWRRG